MATPGIAKPKPSRTKFVILSVSGVLLVLAVVLGLSLRTHKTKVRGPQSKIDPRKQLIDAQDAARASDDFEPTETTTYCNAATYFVAQKVGAPTAGTLTDLKGNLVKANAQATNLAKSPDYKEIASLETQDLADQGRLVIAAYKNPNGPGHLATVRPQEVLGDDPPLAIRVPLLNNIGRSVAVQGVNYAFRKGMKIHYYTPK